MASPIPSSPHSTAQRWPVEECARPNAEILSFGCEIPTDMSFAPTDPDDAAAWPRPVHHHHRSTDNPSQQQGVVGIITMLGRQTVMIWFGWGGIGQEVTTTVAPLDPVRSVGSASHLSMGPFMVAMPRNKYQGAFSAESPTSKLIGSFEGVPSEMIASQMAERLSQRLNMAVFVSCSLEETPSVTGCDGDLERHMLRSRAGALAEGEVVRVLEERFRQQV